MKLIAPGVAGAAFALTLGIMAWHAPRPAQPPPVAAPARQAPAPQWEPPPQTETLVDAPLAQVPPPTAAPEAAPQEPEAQPVTDDSAAVAEPPTLPDSAALPAYQDDQIARHADGARSARSR